MKIYKHESIPRILFFSSGVYTDQQFTMFASSLRSICRNGPVLGRSFSSTAATNAAEVKSLGVIGAGQMVSSGTATPPDGL